MAITPEQKLLRKKYLCSSDASAVLGCNPWKTAGDVWLEKTGRLEDEAEGPEPEHFKRGRLLEPALLNMLDEELGEPGERDVMVFHPNGIFAANLDAIYRKLECVGEAKSSTFVEGWGDPSLGEVPDPVQVQAHFQMICTGFVKAYVPVILPVFGRFSMPIYPIDKVDDLASIIEETCSEWWKKHVIGDTPPEQTPTIESLSRRIRKAGKSVEIKDDFLVEYQSASEEAKDAEKRKEAAKAAIISAMGDAELGIGSVGEFSYKLQSRAAYTVAATSFRMPRLKMYK